MTFLNPLFVCLYYNKVGVSVCWSRSVITRVSTVGFDACSVLVLKLPSAASFFNAAATKALTVSPLF